MDALSGDISGHKGDRGRTMKKLILLLGIVALIAVLPAITRAASVPSILTYQGSMFVDEEPFDGEGFFKLVIVDSSGSSLWSNDGTSVDGSEPAGDVAVTLNEGIFSIVIGDTNISGMDALDPAIFDTADTLYMKAWFDDGVNGFSELTPRVRITSSVYSFNAQLLQGFEPADFFLSSDQIQTDQIADDAVTPDKISAFTASNTAFTVGRGQNDNVLFFADTAAANKPNLRYNVGTSKWQFSNNGVAWSDIGSGGVAPVTSVFGRIGAVVAAANDYTWAQVDKTVSSIADITTRSAGDLISGNLGVARMPTGGAWGITSDLNIDTNTLVVDQANDRVGIGNAAPGTELDVTGTVQQSNAYFFAYDAAGGTTVANSWTNITFDTEVREDGLYTHAPDSQNIRINGTGWYLITADCAADVSDGTRSHADWRLMARTPPGAYAEIPGTRAATYHRSSADGRDSMSITRLISLTNNDRVKLQGRSDRPTQVTTVANACRFAIERK